MSKEIVNGYYTVYTRQSKRYWRSWKNGSLPG